MKVYLIRTHEMNGSSEILETAYLDKATCELFCKEKQEEVWICHGPVEAEGKEINGDRVTVDGEVYNINRTNHITYLAEQALKKLKPEEVVAIKQYYSPD